jgi:hypothetical protein
MAKIQWTMRIVIVISKVVDVTEQCQKQRQSERKIIELLSSGEDDDEADDHDHEDEDDGSVAEGSDARDESSSSYQDDSDDCDEEEDRKLSSSASRKHKTKPPPESPLQVCMDDKDVPAAPGKRDAHEQDETPPPGDYDLEEVSTLVDGAGRKKADR